MTIRAFVVGCAGPLLSAEEAAFLARTQPCGTILFERNCLSADQVRNLVSDMREAVGRDDLLVMIDQEGGSIQRLKPPHWRQYPTAASFGRLYDALDPSKALDSAYLSARLMASDLVALGITVNCVPVLDVPMPHAHPVIGNRAYGNSPELVAMLGRAVADAHLATGVLPVAKHLPGHGRAEADSHENLPIVDAPRSALSETDFAPFRNLNDLPLGMTAHVLYTDLDATLPATVSPTIIGQVIREAIGFQGLLMTDDIAMGALEGPIEERAESALKAGCDVILHCNADLEEMAAVASVAPPLGGRAWERYVAAQGLLRKQADPLDHAAAESALAAALGH